MASKFNPVARLQRWMDSIPGQTFLNYAYSWGASIVILGALFKLTHLPGGNLMLFIGMGTEAFVFFLAAFDRPFDKNAAEKELAEDYVDPEVAANGAVAAGGAPVVSGGVVVGGVPAAGGVAVVPSEGAEGEAAEATGEETMSATEGAGSVQGVPAAGGVVMGGVPAAGGVVMGGVPAAGGVVVGGVPAEGGAVAEGGVVVGGVPAAGGVVMGGGVVGGAPIIIGGGGAAGVLPENVEGVPTAEGAEQKTVDPLQAAVDAIYNTPEGEATVEQEADKLATIIRLANDELLRRAQAVLSPEMEAATEEYIEKLQTLNETLAKVDEQSARLTRDSQEMENLNRTLIGINKVYDLHFASISRQVTTIEDINEQTRQLAAKIEEVNNIYTRMMQQLGVMVNPMGVAPAQPAAAPAPAQPVAPAED